MWEAETKKILKQSSPRDEWKTIEDEKSFGFSCDSRGYFLVTTLTTKDSLQSFLSIYIVCIPILSNLLHEIVPSTLFCLNTFKIPILFTIICLDTHMPFVVVAQAFILQAPLACN